MGIDARIYIESDGTPSELYNGPDVGKVDENDAWMPLGATHRVLMDVRYYAPGYERGPWGEICNTLMSAFASHNVRRVWYFGDCHDEGDEQPITIDDVLAISRHYMLNGNRPYFDDAPVVWRS